MISGRIISTVGFAARVPERSDSGRITGVGTRSVQTIVDAGNGKRLLRACAAETVRSGASCSRKIFQSRCGCFRVAWFRYRVRVGCDRSMSAMPQGGDSAKLATVVEEILRGQFMAGNVDRRVPAVGCLHIRVA